MTCKEGRGEREQERERERERDEPKKMKGSVSPVQPWKGTSQFQHPQRMNGKTGVPGGQKPISQTQLVPNKMDR